MVVLMRSVRSSKGGVEMEKSILDQCGKHSLWVSSHMYFKTKHESWRVLFGLIETTTREKRQMIGFSMKGAMSNFGCPISLCTSSFRSPSSSLSDSYTITSKRGSLSSRKVDAFTSSSHHLLWTSNPRNNRSRWSWYKDASSSLNPATLSSCIIA